MEERSILGRLTVLEQKVEALETLPARVTGVELQIVQLRSEMSAGFSALREEIRGVQGSLREEIRAGDEEMRRFMRILHEDVIARIAAIRET